MDQEPQDPLDTLGEDVATEAPEAESVPEKDGAEEDQPRSEDGRDASPEDKSPEGQADEAAPDETPEVREEADAGTAPEKVEPTPYKYRSDAADYEIPGATVGADGVLTIPSDVVLHVTQLLASGRSYADSRPKVEAAFQQQLKQAQSGEEAANQTKAAVMEQFELVAKMSPEEALEWSEGFREAWPEIRAKAEQAGVEAGRQATEERLKQYERDDYARELEPQLRSGLEEHMTRAHAEDPFLGSLTREDLLVVYDKLMNGWQANGLLLNADQSAWSGERNPQINLVQMRREMEYVASLRRQKNDSTEQATKAKKSNDAEMSESKAPPAVKAKTGPSAEGKPVSQFKLPKGVDPASDEATELVDAWAEGLEV